MTTNDSPSTAVGRRSVLRLLGGAAVSGSALGTVAETTTAQTSEAALDTWFENTSNYDGVVDKTGTSTVTVTVGADGNGGAYGFGPAAIRVDPGTTVVWEWTGDGGVHDVTAEDGSFASELVGDAGHTFEHTFDGEGVSKYVCSPHVSLGMKGAVVVGGSVTQSSTGTAESETASSQGEDVDAWLENTSNYDTVTDQTGLERVTIDVGAEANGGAFGFGPAAVRVSPGTTVVWKWTGKGGSHNVVDTDDAFESQLTSESGHTFEHTFEEAGTHTYACTPHETLGMKGVVVVAEGGDGGSNAQVAEPFDDPKMEDFGGLALAGTFGAAIASPALFGVFLWLKEDETGGKTYPEKKPE
ncbi:halocyanin domain-containing protein [Haloferax sp. MBLA0076]|uniref:Halocyanin domain-containing protein n=1 Tax=Haloferax litoreum TaxID=2666140 RepID=A0A6A8GNT6_9EURY|nr:MULTISPECIES: halocyanin domain-containing protein [Haloferax]KAB1190615.1 halocyanin domain-containing protein [Haloferax sp. CBA1148]MRX23610.1 halocyanin domain-containing protein [Haloferax litoreum]